MRKNKQKNSKNTSKIVYNLLIFQKNCDKINKSKGYLPSSSMAAQMVSDRFH